MLSKQTPSSFSREKLNGSVNFLVRTPGRWAEWTMDRMSRFCHHTDVVKSLAEDWMSLSTHLAELTQKHKLLERQISETMARPSKDELEVRRLKREKLKLKDRIAELKS
jgi:hypothetical protein